MSGGQAVLMAGKGNFQVHDPILSRLVLHSVLDADTTQAIIYACFDLYAINLHFRPLTNRGRLPRDIKEIIMLGRILDPQR